MFPSFPPVHKSEGSDKQGNLPPRSPPWPESVPLVPVRVTEILIDKDNFMVRCSVSVKDIFSSLSDP